MVLKIEKRLDTYEAKIKAFRDLVILEIER